MLDVQLVQEQRFRLSITPEMKQSFHLLTLSGQELIRYLQDAAADNPLLELEEPFVDSLKATRRNNQHMQAFMTLCFKPKEQHLHWKTSLLRKFG